MLIIGPHPASHRTRKNLQRDDSSLFPYLLHFPGEHGAHTTSSTLPCLPGADHNLGALTKKKGPEGGVLHESVRRATHCHWPGRHNELHADVEGGRNKRPVSADDAVMTLLYKELLGMACSLETQK